MAPTSTLTRTAGGPAGIDHVDDLVRALDILRRRAAGPSCRRIGLDRLSRATGIPRSSLHAYLSGAVLPPPDRLDAIVVALGVDPRETRPWADALDRLLDGALAHRRTTVAGDGPQVIPVFACVTSADTDVYADPTPAAPRTGFLRAGNSWVVRQVRGALAPVDGSSRRTGEAHDIWLYTQGDDARRPHDGWGWIPAAVVRDAVAGRPLRGVPWAVLA